MLFHMPVHVVLLFVLLAAIEAATSGSSLTARSAASLGSSSYDSIQANQSCVYLLVQHSRQQQSIAMCFIIFVNMLPELVTARTDVALT